LAVLELRHQLAVLLLHMLAVAVAVAEQELERGQMLVEQEARVAVVLAVLAQHLEQMALLELPTQGVAVAVAVLVGLPTQQFLAVQVVLELLLFRILLHTNLLQPQAHIRKQLLVATTSSHSLVLAP